MSALKLKKSQLRRFNLARYTNGLYGGHTTGKDQDFKEVHESMMGLNDRSVKEKMICSEFVAKSTVASFVELNERLGKKLEEKGIEVGEGVIKVPISKQERLEKIHPERLVKLLNKSGCLEKVDKAPVLDGLVSQERLTQNEKSKGVSKDLYNKMNDLAKEGLPKEQFVEKGKKIFEVYIKSENIANKLNTKEDIDKHLDYSLKEFHQEYDKRNPQTFGGKFKQVLNRFAEWAGIKDNKAEKIIKNTIKHIEKGAPAPSVESVKSSQIKQNMLQKLLEENPEIKAKLEHNKNAEKISLPRDAVRGKEQYKKVLNSSSRGWDKRSILMDMQCAV